MYISHVYIARVRHVNPGAPPVSTAQVGGAAPSTVAALAFN